MKKTPKILDNDNLKQQFLNVAYTLAVVYEVKDATMLTDVLPNTSVRCKATITLDIVKEDV